MTHVATLWRSLAAATLLVALAACDHSFLFDREGYCPETENPEPEPTVPTPPEYLAHFLFDYNMDYADHFADEVPMVSVAVIDEDNNIVWQGTDSGSTLASDGYRLVLPVAAGSYHLLAWAGSTDKGSYTIGTGTTGDALTATLARKDNSTGGIVDSDIDRWYYGYTALLTFPSAEGTYTYDISLTKDTNIFRIALANSDGSTIASDRYSVALTADNGTLDWQNSPLAGDILTYQPWETYQGSTAADPYETRGADAATIAVSTVSRLVTTVPVTLTIWDNDNDEELLSVPLLDYLLLTRGNYPSITSDQEYLDREDEWEVLFVLVPGTEEEEDKYYWLGADLYINSWHVVLQQTAL